MISVAKTSLGRRRQEIRNLILTIACFMWLIHFGILNFREQSHTLRANLVTKHARMERIANESV